MLDQRNRKISFSEQDIQTTNTLYLTEVCLGLQSSFNNFETDPAHSNSTKILKSRISHMKKSLRMKKIHLERENNTILEISDEIRTLFNTSSENDQHKMLAMLSFDYKNTQISMKPCHTCKCIVMIPSGQNPQTIFCKGCKKLDKQENIEFLVKENLLPLWKSNNEWQYEQPMELMDLTLGEKLCIQKYQGKILLSILLFRKFYIEFCVCYLTS